MTVLGERIALRIAERGPMPVSSYVDACLYDPDCGFFMQQSRAAGRGGHFLTAPEVGPLFGAVLARALDEWWSEMGEPDPFVVIDWGAGPGTLARAVLAAGGDCLSAGALRLVLVEVSPAQRGLHPRHPLVVSTARAADALRSGESAGVVVANELLDNLPFDVVRRAGDTWEELLVAAGADQDAALQRRAGSPGTFGLVAEPARHELVAGLPQIAAGAVVPVQRAARGWVAEAHSLLGAGRVVAFDYAATTAELAARHTAGDAAASGWGWLRTHRDHQVGHRWLESPGSCDITVDVALDQIQAQHQAQVSTQAEFLQRHGIDDLVSEGRAVWRERAAVGDLEALRARSRSSEAEALLDPSGMGAFSVLVWSVV